LNSYVKDLDPGQMAQKHREAVFSGDLEESLAALLGKDVQNSILENTILDLIRSSPAMILGVSWQRIPEDEPCGIYGCVREQTT
jgi:hypothetical protein